MMILKYQMKQTDISRWAPVVEHLGEKKSGIFYIRWHFLNRACKYPQRCSSYWSWHQQSSENNQIMKAHSFNFTQANNWDLRQTTSLHSKFLCSTSSHFWTPLFIKFKQFQVLFFFTFLYDFSLRANFTGILSSLQYMPCIRMLKCKDAGMHHWVTLFHWPAAMASNVPIRYHVIIKSKPFIAFNARSTRRHHCTCAFCAQLCSFPKAFSNIPKRIFRFAAAVGFICPRASHRSLICCFLPSWHLLPPIWINTLSLNF